MFCKINLYFWTLKDLKLVQILYRIKLLLFKKYPVIKSYIFEINMTKKNKFNWIMKNVNFPKNNVYKFLNKSEKVKNFSLVKTIKDEKLWLYNLNYFDFLITKTALIKKKKCVYIIENWINTKPSANKIGWDPYPTSLRIVNWIKWCLYSKIYNENILNSLYAQGIYLNKNIEWHLLGNHLIANAKGLIFFGTFFSDSHANQILKNGEKLLNQELDEQFLNDGGHFERSPMYHSIVLEDLLDIIELNSIFPNRISKKLIEKIKKTTKVGINWLILLCHPDKNISFFNDSTHEIASHPSKIINFYNLFQKKISFKNFESEKLSSSFLNDSKYFICKNKNFKTIIDLGSPSPKYQPGHSHAETFSFELSLFNQRVFVNTGISEYQISKRRLLERSTIAHNTACIENINSSQIWSSFRIAKKAKVINISRIQKKEFSKIKMQHNGYSKLFKPLIHNREIDFHNNKIEFIDSIRNARDFFVVYILHPEIKIELKHNECFLKLKHDKELILFFNDSKVKLIDWYYARKFGGLIKTKCLHVISKSEEIKTSIYWKEN